MNLLDIGQAFLGSYYNAQQNARANQAQQLQRDQMDWERSRVERQDRLQAEERARQIEANKLAAEVYRNGPNAAPGVSEKLFEANPDLAVHLNEVVRQRQSADQAKQIEGEKMAANFQRALAVAPTPEARGAIEQRMYELTQRGILPRTETTGPESTPEQVSDMGAKADAILGPPQPEQMTPEQRNFEYSQTHPGFDDYLRKGKQQQATVGDLRKEFQGSQVFKDAQQVQTAYRKVRAASPSAAGDMALIFGYMKLLDPGSTVREGEYATAEQAQGVDGRVISLYNRLLKGETLSPDARANFKSEATRVFAAQRRSIDDQANEYRRLATQEGYSPNDVVLDLWGERRPTNQPAGKPTPTDIARQVTGGAGSVLSETPAQPTQTRRKPKRQPPTPRDIANQVTKDAPTADDLEALWSQ